jgi:AsmA protein
MRRIVDASPMSRSVIKRVAIGIGIVVAVLVVAGVVFTATFDVNRYKPQIAEAVHARTGRTLRFDGDLSLVIFPRVAMKLPATTLSEPGRDAVFARVRSAEAVVELLPLLRKEVKVDALRVDGLQFTLVRQKDGSTNVDDLLKPAQSPGGGGAPATAPSPTEATIGGIALKEADITWRDLMTGRTIRLAGLDLNVGRYGPGERTPVEGGAAVTLNEPALAARVSAKGEIERTEQGGLRAVRGLAVKADGTIKQQAVKLNATAEHLAGASDLLEIEGLKVAASSKGEGGNMLELQLVVPRVKIDQGKAGSQRIEASFTRRGPAVVEARIVVEGLRGTAARMEAASVKVAGSTRSSRRTARFDGSGTLVASLNDRTASIENASGGIVIEDTALAQESIRVNLTASASVDGPREAVAAQFESRAEGASMRGKVSAKGFSAPHIAFDLQADQLDADRYFPPFPKPSKSGTGGAAVGAAAPGSTPPGSGDERVDLSALRGLNATGNVHVGRLHVKGTDLTDVRIAVKADNGRVDIAPFSLRAHGGSVSGRVALDANGNRVAASGSVNGVQLRSLLKEISGRAVMEGSANGTFDLASAGTTVTAMKRALDGSVAMEVREGALLGIDLAGMIGNAVNVLPTLGKQTGTLDENKRTPFSQLSGSVRIKDGVATNNDLKAKSPQLDLSGAGRLDLVSTELDYTLQTRVQVGPGSERSALRSLAGITVPVQISGQLEHPSYAVDWAPVAAQLLVRGATGGVGAPVVNEVIKGLGGLLGKKK